MRQLTAPELLIASKLISDLEATLAEASTEDPELKAALRRRIAKVLGEKAEQADRKKMKKLIRARQEGLCSRCGKPLTDQGTVLVGFERGNDETGSAASLVCPDCAANS